MNCIKIINYPIRFYGEVKGAQLTSRSKNFRATNKQQKDISHELVEGSEEAVEDAAGEQTEEDRVRPPGRVLYAMRLPGRQSLRNCCTLGSFKFFQLEPTNSAKTWAQKVCFVCNHMNRIKISNTTETEQ